VNAIPGGAHHPDDLLHTRRRRPEGQKPRISSHDAAKESNLPSRGLPGPASFEGRVLPGFSVGYKGFG
jgi:hypothetical protein